VVLGALVYRLLVWCGAVGYVSGLRDAAASRKSDNKFCNKEPSVASSWPFYFHVLMMMHGQTHIMNEFLSMISPQNVFFNRSIS
jgi:hypothetical protein